MFGIRLAVKYAVEGGMSPWIVHQSYQGSAPGCSGVLHQVGRAPLQRNTEVRLRRGWQLGPLPAQYQFQRVPVKGEARMKKKLVNNIIIMDEKRGWYSLVSPFYERLGGLWRCPRNEIGDMLPGGQKCIHLVAVLLFAVTQCRFKPLQIGRRLNTRAKKKKKQVFFQKGEGMIRPINFSLRFYIHVIDPSIATKFKRYIFLLNIDIDRSIDLEK